MEKSLKMTIVVAVIVAVLTSAITVAVMTPNVLFAPYTTTIGQGGPIKANSCDADSVCEINGNLSSNSDYLSLGKNKAITISEITGNVGIGVPPHPDIVKLIITSEIQAIDAISNSGVAVEGATQDGRGVYGKSHSGISVQGQTQNGTAINAQILGNDGYGFYQSGLGKNYFESRVGIGITNPTEELDINGNVKISDLNGTGNAYVCVGATGKLYRSQTPCT
ncbi:hypothetical protein HY450_03540 [Candidatus Pacearchaeota archaeon]|nr:hypothetical protein [Candidatus Pacearchaeota archaeon]